MSILNWFKKDSTNQQQTNDADSAQQKKKFKISDWFTSTPTELDENGKEVPVQGTKPVSDPHKTFIPLLLSYMAVKNPDAGLPMLTGYMSGRQQELDRQKEDAWKQWEIKAKQKRQALEDERWQKKWDANYVTVPNNQIDYGQYVQNPMTTGFKLDGGFKPQDQLQERINNLGQVNNQIPFLNFNQQEQQQMPSLSSA
jgi:hypothetical protein